MGVGHWESLSSRQSPGSQNLWVLEALSAQSILSGKAAKCIFRALANAFVVGAVCIFGHVQYCVLRGRNPSPPPFPLSPLPSPPLHSFTLPKLSITMSTGARHHEHHVAHVAQGGRFAGLKTQKAFAKRVLGHLSRIRASCRGAFRGARKTHRPRAAFRGARKTHRLPSRYGSTRSRVYGLEKCMRAGVRLGGPEKRTGSLRVVIPPGAGFTG